MALWMVRGGSHGEYESKFIDDSRLYLTWGGLNTSLSKIETRDALVVTLGEFYPQSGLNRRRNHASQLWPFAHSMKTGDWVVLPRKTDRTICVCEIVSDYQFHAKAEDPFFHSRRVKWLAEGLPRTYFGQDLLNSFGAFMTVCRVERNNAEARLKAMAANGWKPEKLSDIVKAGKSKNSPNADASDTSAAETDLETAGQDQIAKLIMARFKDHGLARLVEAILQAQHYSTYRSPKGSDGGVDIIAGSGPLGFGEPRLCVQVKSHVDVAAGIKEYNELRGAMQTVGATQGLFVSWAGYTDPVRTAARNNFFSVRLWTQRELFDALFDVYENLPADIRAELPLQRIWTVAPVDEE